MSTLQKYLVLMRHTLYFDIEVEAADKSDAIEEAERRFETEPLEALDCKDSSYAVEDVQLVEGGAP